MVPLSQPPYRARRGPPPTAPPTSSRPVTRVRARQLLAYAVEHLGVRLQVGVADLAVQLDNRTIPRLSKADLTALPACCDMAWLSDLTVRQWQSVLAACGRSLSAGSVTDLAACVQQPVARR